MARGHLEANLLDGVKLRDTQVFGEATIGGRRPRKPGCLSISDCWDPFRVLLVAPLGQVPA